MANLSRQPSMPPQPVWVRLCQWLWKQRGFVWGTVICGIALNLFASWLLTPSGATFSNTPLGEILGHPLLLALGGFGLLILTGGLWLINRLHSAPPSQQVSPRLLTEQDRQNVAASLRRVYQRLLSKSLQGDAPMALGLHERNDVTRSSAQLIFSRTYIENELSLPSGTSIIQEYDRAGRGGLLLLGKAGAGKTTLLLNLASELLTRAEGDRRHPVPVILNLSSLASKKPPQLASWLIDQLSTIYGIPSRLSQMLLEQDQWLLLLDGLDEVEASARSRCIEAINTYRTEHFTPLVVCSRGDEYLKQEARLTLESAVEIQPLQEQEVMTYLKRIGKPMAAVGAVLKTNPVLKQLLTTPLWLSIVTLTYRDKAVKDLPQLGTGEQQQQQILERYVERMVEQRTTKGHYTSKQTRHWLTWLAKRMKETNFFYLGVCNLIGLTTSRGTAL